MFSGSVVLIIREPRKSLFESAVTHVMESLREGKDEFWEISLESAGYGRWASLCQYLL